MNMLSALSPKVMDSNTKWTWISWVEFPFPTQPFLMEWKSDIYVWFHSRVSWKFIVHFWWRWWGWLSLHLIGNVFQHEICRTVVLNNTENKLFLWKVTSDPWDDSTFYQLSLSCSQLLRCSLNIFRDFVKFKSLPFANLIIP